MKEKFTFTDRCNNHALITKQQQQDCFVLARKSPKMLPIQLLGKNTRVCVDPSSSSPCVQGSTVPYEPTAGTASCAQACEGCPGSLCYVPAAARRRGRQPRADAAGTEHSGLRDLHGPVCGGGMAPRRVFWVELRPLPVQCVGS